MSRGYKHTVHKERSGFKYTFNLTAWWEKWDLNLSMLQKLFDNSAAITLEKQLNHPSLMRMKIGTISKKEYWQWKWKSLSCVWLFVSPWTIYSPWNSPGQNTGVGSRSLLQGESAEPRGWTQVSHIEGRFLTSWATKEAQEYWVG